MADRLDFTVSSGALRDGLALCIRELRARASRPPTDAAEQYARIEADFEALAQATRMGLLRSALAWSEDERVEARWLCRTNDELAVLGFLLWEPHARHGGSDNAAARRLMARTLMRMAES